MRVQDKRTIDDYYRALLERDPSYVGIFFAGIRTTNIFCIATCHARKPRPENVEFFTDLKDALAEGYRPCKICRPTESAPDIPGPVREAMALVKENPGRKISDGELRKRGIGPESVRRWFQRNYGITFQAYQRMCRINSAYGELQGGKGVTETAMESGYESLSGFAYAYKKLVGKSPGKSLGENIILISRLATPLGPMFVCATDEGVCLLEFTDRRMLETEFSDLQRLLKARIMVGENDHIRQAKGELEEYFRGTRTDFDVPLVSPGSEFQNRVWANLKKIPYGELRSYQEQAAMMGNPRAVRAVGTANGHNRISIIIPCHRVIGKDGSLTGYGGGLERKRWLIGHEQKNAPGKPGA